MLWFETPEELDRAVADVAAIGIGARRVLAKAIETQGYGVTKVSGAARLLEDHGFLFIRETSAYDGSATLCPTLWGEEALDVYEERKNKK